VQYFQTQCPALPGLRENEAAAEWIVDLTTQADRQGRASDFAAAYAKSELKAEVDQEIAAQLAQASDLGGCLQGGGGRQRGGCGPCLVVAHFRTFGCA
jgi:hypothetical protein